MVEFQNLGSFWVFFKHSSATKKTGIWDDSQDNHKVVPPKVTKMAYNPILLVRYITNKNP